MRKTFLKIAWVMMTGYMLNACTTNKSNSKDGLFFEQTREIIASDSIEIEKVYNIFNPVYIVSSNDSIWIVVGDETSEMVYLFDHSGKCEAKGIRLGKGPNEVLEISSIHHIVGRTMVYDARKGELSGVFRADSSLFLVPLASKLHLQDDAFILLDGKVLSMPVMGGYSYALLDKDGNVIDSLDYYPPKPEGVTEQTHSLACTGTAAFMSKHGRLARTLAYDGAIDFFRIDESLLKHISRQEEFGMDYSVVDAGQLVPTFSETTRMGYWSLTASDNTFYALFSDELALEGSDCYREIHAFASEGTPLCKYLPDHELSSIAVKPDNSTLYGIGTSDNESVVLYIYDIRK